MGASDTLTYAHVSTTGCAAADEEERIAAEVNGYLQQLDELRAEAERNSDYLRAHECVSRMREANLRYATRIERVAKSTDAGLKASVGEDQRREVLTFERLWDDKLAAHETEAASAVAELQLRQAKEFEAQRAALKVQLLNSRPKLSRRVVDLRNELQAAVQQRRYLDADKAKRQLAVAEREELDSFDRELSATFDRRVEALKSPFANEMTALLHKIEAGRGALLQARDREREILTRRHEQSLTAIERDAAMRVSRTRAQLNRQVTALAADPLRTTVDFRMAAAAARSKPGYRVAAARARTPPATASRSSQRTLPASQQPPVIHDAGDDTRFGW